MSRKRARPRGGAQTNFCGGKSLVAGDSRYQHYFAASDAASKFTAQNLYLRSRQDAVTARGFAAAATPSRVAFGDMLRPSNPDARHAGGVLRSRLLHKRSRQDSNLERQFRRLM